MKKSKLVNDVYSVIQFKWNSKIHNATVRY